MGLKTKNNKVNVIKQLSQQMAKKRTKEFHQMPIMHADDAATVAAAGGKVIQQQSFHFFSHLVFHFLYHDHAFGYYSFIHKSMSQNPRL